MKIEHVEVKVARILGHYSDEVTFPNNEKGEISFNFEYEPEFEALNVTGGLLILNKKSSVTFEKLGTMLYKSHFGPNDEEINTSEVISNHIAVIAAKLKRSEVEAKIKDR